MQTDDPGTPGNNNWEINVAYTVARTREFNVYSVPILDINYGVGSRIQLKYQVPYLFQSTDGGPLESGLSLKLAWRRFPAFASRCAGIGGYAAPPIARIPRTATFGRLSEMTIV